LPIASNVTVQSDTLKYLPLAAEHQTMNCTIDQQYIRAERNFCCWPQHR